MLPLICRLLRASCASTACSTVYAVTCMVQLTLGTPEPRSSANRYQNPGKRDAGVVDNCQRVRVREAEAADADLRGFTPRSGVQATGFRVWS